MDYLTVFDSHLRNMEYADHQNFFPIHFDSCQDPLLIQQYLYIDILLPHKSFNLICHCSTFLPWIHKTTDFNIFWFILVYLIWITLDILLQMA